MENCFSAVRTFRGQDVVQKIRRYEKTLLNISSLKNRLDFLKNCLANHVMPNSFQQIKNADGSFFGVIQRSLLENAITLLKREKNSATFRNRQAFRILQEINIDRYVGDALAFVRNNVSIIGSRQHYYLEAKLENLFRKSHWIRFSQIKNVKNISNRILSRDEVVVLGLGLNFCLGQGNNFFIEFNSQVNAINSEKHNDLTAFLRGVAVGSHSRHSDILPEKLKIAISRLMKYKDVKIMKSDKGNTVVVMNTEDYKSKMYQLLEDENTYKIINWNFNVSTWQQNFNSSLKKIIHPIDKKVYDNSVSPKLPVIPYLYGLPKIHKVGVPMRPIVASLRAPARNLSIWLTKTLSPFIGLVSQSHLKHSLDFIDTLKDVNSNFNS